MLGSLRKNTGHWALKFLLVAVGITMAMFGVDQAQQSGRGGGAAAYVNGEAIPQIVFQRVLSQRMEHFQNILGAQYNENLLSSLRIPESTLDSLIQQKLMVQQAREMDLMVSDVELAYFIRSIPYFQKDGKFDKELYNRIPNRGFEEKIQREDLQAQKLRDYVQGRVRLTPREVRRNYQLSNTKMKVQYAEVDVEKLSQKFKPSRADLKKLMAAASDDELQQVYEANKLDYTTKARVKLRQIRAAIPFKASEARKKKSFTKIQEAAKELNATNFADMAKKHSDDPFASRGGDRGWVDRGTLPAEIERAIDPLAAGQVSGVVESPTGYFLLFVENKQDAQTKEFAEVRDQVAKELAEKKHKEKIETEKIARWNKMLAKGTNLNAELKRAGMEIKTTALFSLADGRIPEIRGSDAFFSEVAKLTKNNRVPKQLLREGPNVYYVRFVSDQKPNMKNFDKNKEQTERTLQFSIQNAILGEWLQSLEKDAEIKKLVKFEAENPSVVQ